MNKAIMKFEDIGNDVTLLRNLTTSALFDDYVVTPMPELAIITLEELAKVLEIAKEFAIGPKGENGQGRQHPFVSKWICPRCGSWLRLDGKAKWLRCEGTNARRLGWSDKPTCDAPPVDLGAGERLMFSALDHFREGREGSFSAIARVRYDEVIRASLEERRELEQEIQYRRLALKNLADDLEEHRGNRGFTDALKAKAAAHDVAMESAVIQLQDMRSEPEESDPETSLLELDNMVAEIKVEGPFGFEVDEAALTLRNRLRDVVHSVTMVELGDDRYDIEFQIDVSAIFRKKGTSVESVRFKDVPMKAGSYATRRRKASIQNDIDTKRHALTDKEWKSRPDLPLAVSMFGDDLRWVMDMMVVMAEWNGYSAAVKLGGERVKSYKVGNYRRSAECLEVVDWLQRVRPRSHGYVEALPRLSKFPTLRERLVPGHPLLDLQRFKLSKQPQPLSDDEFDALMKIIPVRRQFQAGFRSRIDQMIDMMRNNHTEGRLGKTGLGKWLDRHQHEGTFQQVVNFFRGLEGKEALGNMPLIPKFDVTSRR